ncbi:MAG: RNA polymerase sigma factor [Steroidobacteraceae bacterium]
MDRWFVDEVLPLEPALMRLLRRYWRRGDDVPDLRQEVYTRVYEGAARDGIPAATAAYVFRTARNLLIDQARRARVVSFDLVAELEELPEAPRDEWSPERMVAARAELRLLERALESLPPRCREVVSLRRIDGLSQKTIAARLGIAEGTVEKHVTIGMRALAETLAGQGVDIATDWLTRTGRRVDRT